MTGHTHRIAAAGALAAAVLLVVVVFSSGGRTHTLDAAFDSAIQLTPGQEVRVAGRKVGEVGDITLADGLARVKLKISDGDAWPLPRGTVARARWGSTTSYLSRYVELYPGPQGAGALADGAILPTKDTRSAFELDQSYRIFRGHTRAQTSRLIDDLGAGVGPEGAALRRGLAAAPGGLGATADVMQELGADGERLRTLADAGDRTTTALASRADDLQRLVADAAGAFDELAAHTRAQQVALDRAPHTFDVATTTLRRMDRSIDGLDALVSDLGPGGEALRRFAVAARPAVHALREVSPAIVATLAAGTGAAPHVQTLLRTLTPLLADTRTALDGFAPHFDCLRPYTPEIIGFLSTWTGQLKNYDASGHYARSFPLTVIPSLLPGTTNTPAQAVAREPGISYAMPRPPGLNAGKPWFLPQCGITPKALDAAADPEVGAR